MYEEELANLSMTPEKWEHLMSCVDGGEYDRISQDYNKRKDGLFQCSAKWGFCQNQRNGKCVYSGACEFKS